MGVPKKATILHGFGSEAWSWRAGRAMMGEVTFNQIYGGNDTTCDVNLGPHAASPEDSLGGTGCLMMEELTGNLDGELQEGDGTMAALHESLQQTLRSAPSNEADDGGEGGSPTGKPITIFDKGRFCSQCCLTHLWHKCSIPCWLHV